MNFDLYILDENDLPKQEPDVLKWAEWRSEFKKKSFIALEEFGGYRVSTVFLGVDYNFMSFGPPILWETMVFGDGTGHADLDAHRCAGSKDQALEMHKMVVAKWRDKVKALAEEICQLTEDKIEPRKT